MNPVAPNQQVIMEDLKECERECRKRLFNWLDETRMPDGINNLKKIELIKMFENLPLWTRENAGGHALFRHKITRISVSFQAHGQNNLQIHQSKNVLDCVQRHVNILGNQIFQVNRGWEEKIDFNQAYNNYLQYAANPNPQ